MAEFDARLIQIGDLGDQLKRNVDSGNAVFSGALKGYENYQQAQAQKAEQAKRAAIGEVYKQNYDPETGRINWKNATSQMMDIDPLFAKEHRDKEEAGEIKYKTDHSNMKNTVSENDYKMANRFGEYLSSVNNQEGWTNIMNMVQKEAPHLAGLFPSQFSPMAKQQAMQMVLGVKGSYEQMHKGREIDISERNSNTNQQNANTSEYNAINNAQNDRARLGLDERRLTLDETKARIEAENERRKLEGKAVLSPKEAAEIERINIQTRGEKAKFNKDNEEQEAKIKKDILTTEEAGKKASDFITTFKSSVMNSDYVEKETYVDDSGETVTKPKLITYETIPDGKGNLIPIQGYAIKKDKSRTDILTQFLGKYATFEEGRKNLELSQQMQTALGTTINSLVSGGASIQGLTDSEGKALASLLTGMNTGSYNDLTDRGLSEALYAYDKALSNLQSKSEAKKAELDKQLKEVSSIEKYDLNTGKQVPRQAKQEVKQEAKSGNIITKDLLNKYKSQGRTKQEIEDFMKQNGYSLADGLSLE